MELIQVLIMLILSLAFNNGSKYAEPPKVSDEEVIKSLFSGENELRGWAETEEGIIQNPIYKDAWGPSDDPTNQVEPQESDYFDIDEPDVNNDEPRKYWDSARESWVEY